MNGYGKHARTLQRGQIITSLKVSTHLAWFRRSEQVLTDTPIVVLRSTGFVQGRHHLEQDIHLVSVLAHLHQEEFPSSMSWWQYIHCHLGRGLHHRHHLPMSTGRSILGQTDQTLQLSRPATVLAVICSDQHHYRLCHLGPSPSGDLQAPSSKNRSVGPHRHLSSRGIVS